MQGFSEWWGSLSVLNQWFFVAAGFFSVFFLWQLVSAFLGLSADHDDLSTDAGTDAAHHAPEDADATVMAFKLFSVRSIEIGRAHV